MKNFRGLLVFNLIILSTLLVSCSLEPKEDDSSDGEMMIKFTPRVYQNTVVWGSFDGIYLYDISTEKVTKITDIGWVADCGDYIYGNYLALTDIGEYPGCAVYLVEISSRKKSVIVEPEVCEGTYCYFCELEIYKNFIAYTRSYTPCIRDYPQEKKQDIFLYDISDGSSKNLTQSEGTNERGRPVIWENLICWIEFDKDSIDCYNAKTRNKISFEVDGVDIEWIDLYENLIIFSGDIDNKNKHVFLLNIETGEVEQLTQNGTRYDRSLAIYGNTVVWEEARKGQGCDRADGCTNIYMFNLDTGEGRFIKKEGSSQGCPDIWDKYVVWIGMKNFDVFLYDISTGKLKKISLD